MLGDLLPKPKYLTVSMTKPDCEIWVIGLL